MVNCNIIRTQKPHVLTLSHANMTDEHLETKSVKAPTNLVLMQQKEKKTQKIPNHRKTLSEKRDLVLTFECYAGVLRQLAPHHVGTDLPHIELLWELV